MSRKMLILYGSETGTAQDTAEQIWRDAKRLGLQCSVMAMDEYVIENLVAEKLVVFVAATTGQGDSPSNMKKFWRFLLRKSLPTNSLINVQYAVLGLGDSSYQKYNFTAKKLNRRLAQLGGRELLPIGLADDQHDLGIDAVVGPWVEDLWEKVSGIFNTPKRVSSSAENKIIERFKIDIVSQRTSKVYSGAEESEDNIYRHELCMDTTIKIGTILENVKTTSEDHFQDVRLIKLRASNVDYSPGDVIYVRPQNSAEKVQRFFDVLANSGVNICSDMVLNISEKEITVPNVLKQSLTLKQIVEQYWDLNYKPRRYVMQILGSISDNELEKEKLVEFTTPNGQEELFNYVNRPRRNILEVLNDFPHTTSKLNINLLFEIMSAIKPRAFSIASSLKHTKDEIHLLVAVVKYKTKLMEPRLGLASNWLASLKETDEIIFWIQNGTFKFDYSKPAILIGPGTGVAPFRAHLLERITLNHDLSNCLLFFGCRNEWKDYHCREDFEIMSKNYNLRVFCAFSRDQDHKIYVQHKIRDQGKLCWEFLQNGANVYLAGSSKNMPDNVREEFVNIAKTVGNLEDGSAENFINQLEKDSRYQTETWG